MTLNTICILKTTKFIFLVPSLSELQTHISSFLPLHLYLFTSRYSNLNVRNWTLLPLTLPHSFSFQLMATLYSQLLKVKYLESFSTLSYIPSSPSANPIDSFYKIYLEFDCFLLFLLLVFWSSLAWMSVISHCHFLFGLQ